MRAVDLIGAPWRPGGRDPAVGLDCWGVVLAATPGLPETGAQPGDIKAIFGAFRAGMCDARAERLQKPRDGCIVMLSVAKKIHHCGIYWRGYLIHADGPVGVVADKWRDVVRRYSRVEFWNWNTT